MNKQLTLKNYFSYPLDIKGQLNDLRTKNSSYWLNKGRNSILNLSNYLIHEVEAYKLFLSERNINPTQITEFEVIKSLPPINKKNYLNKYSMNSLVPKDYITKISTFSATSGSSGTQTYIPRGEEHDKQFEYIAELMMRNQFEIEKKSTLCLLSFALGIWIGGIFSYKVFNSLAQKGYPISVAPIGTNKEIFIKTLMDIGPNYDQVILMGYPPFLKDIIDIAAQKNIDFKKYSIKIFTGTESFSEEFRNYLVEKTFINKYTDITSVYGSAELGTMALETPLSILIREQAYLSQEIFNKIFPEANTLPTLAQYHPYLIYFEEENQELFASGWGSAYPLIRYQLFDKGGVITFDQMKKKLSEFGIDILKLAEEKGIKDTVFKLPFVYVHERSDNVVTIYGINIYPSYIRNALLSKKVSEFVTGKFAIQKKEEADLNSFLEIYIELKKDSSKSNELENLLSQTVLQALCQNSGEFNYLFSSEKDTDLVPKIILCPYEDENYFKPEIKQKWTIK